MKQGVIQLNFNVYRICSHEDCRGVATNTDGSFTITNYGTVSLSDPHQMQCWGIIWNAPNDQTKFWITNSYNPVRPRPPGLETQPQSDAR